MAAILKTKIYIGSRACSIYTYRVRITRRTCTCTVFDVASDQLEEDPVYCDQNIPPEVSQSNKCDHK